MNDIELKTTALNAAVAGASRDGNIMEAAQRYYVWLKGKVDTVEETTEETSPQSGKRPASSKRSGI